MARAPTVFINGDHRWARMGAGSDPVSSLGSQLPGVIVTDTQAITAEISAADVDPVGVFSRSFLVEGSIAIAITERYAFLFVMHPHNFLHELPYEL